MRIIVQRLRVYECINFWVLLIGYFLSEQGKLCSDNGNDEVDHFKLCKAAAYALNKPFQSGKTDAYHPKGCYLGGFESFYGVYYNEHSVGRRRSSASQICKPKGKA